MVPPEHPLLLSGFFQTIFLAHRTSVKIVLFRWFFTILLAEKFGIFKYWRIDIFSGAADNNPEDSFI
jgi:hypothetical protein